MTAVMRTRHTGIATPHRPRRRLIMRLASHAAGSGKRCQNARGQQRTAGKYETVTRMAVCQQPRRDQSNDLASADEALQQRDAGVPLAFRKSLDSQHIAGGRRRR